MSKLKSFRFNGTKLLYKMKKIIVYIFFIVLVLHAISVDAQSVSGIVLDVKGKPIAFATLALYNVNDTSTLLTTGYTNSDGAYNVNYLPTKKDSLILQVSCLGYTSKQVIFSKSTKNLGVMRLKEENYVLENVVVTSHRLTYTYKDGVLKARVENLSNNSADKLIDVLKRMPGVVATDNSIMVNGASPVVIINGVKQHIPISQLITYLSTVPATNTETIAINTNQLAENKLGSEEVTISIESKKKALDGYQLTNSTYGQLFRKSSFKYGNYTDALLKYGNLSGNVSFGLNNRSYYNQSEENDYDGSKLSSDNRLKKFAYFGIMNFTWTPKPINGSINIYCSYYRDDAKNKKNEEYAASGIVDKQVNRSNKDVPDLLSLNIEYDSNDSLRNQFKLAYGLLSGKDDFSENFCNNLDLAGFMGKKINGHQHILEGQYMYKIPTLEFKVGTQVYLSRLKENYREDVSLLSNYHITENLNSFYTSLQWKFLPKASLYIGARYEHTYYKYLDDGDKGSETYGNFAPSLVFNWKVQNNYDTSLKFSSENIRPGFYDLLPGKTIVSDKEYSQGNITLMPAKKYKFIWENLLFHYVSLNATVMWIKDYWGTYYGINEQDMRFSTNDNISDFVSYIGSLSVPFAFMNNKIRGSLNLSGRYNKFYNFKDGIDQSYLYGRKAWHSNGNLYVGYEITSRFGFYLNPYYETKTRRLQTVSKGCSSMNLGMQYKLLKDKSLVLSLTAYDIFNQERESSKIFYGNKSVANYEWASTQNVMLTLSYTLNHNAKSIKINRNANDTDRFTNNN